MAHNWVGRQGQQGRRDPAARLQHLTPPLPGFRWVHCLQAGQVGIWVCRQVGIKMVTQIQNSFGI